MAGYEPKEWKCGDTITADDLNHMEQGIANSGGTEHIVFTVTKRQATEEECSGGGTVSEFSHSWQELHDALLRNAIVTRVFVDEISNGVMMEYLTQVAFQEKHYAIFIDANGTDGATMFFTNATDKTAVNCDQAD